MATKEAITISRLDMPGMANPNDFGWRGQLFKDTDQQSAVPLYAVNKDRRPNSKHQEVIVYPSAWSDGPGKRLNQQRAEALAHTLDRPVVVVGSPGVEVGSLPMTDKMKDELRRGETDEVNKAMWSGVEQALDTLGMKFSDTESNVKLTMLGYSKGAWDVHNMSARAPKGVRIDRLNMWELADISGRGTLAIMANYALHGSTNWDNEMAMNPEWVERPNTTALIAEQLRKRPHGLLLYPKAMAKGRPLVENIRQALSRGVIDDQTPVTLLSGRESHISPAADNLRIANALGGLGLRNLKGPYVVDYMFHASSDNLPLFVDLARQTIK